MRWQIARFIFCDQHQTISNGQNTQQIEPLVVELLSYFCRNKDQIISREQLIEHVWQGRIVSDSAVNRVITKLRKLFNDDAKKPKFIATFSKKGYKFIAVVSVIEETATVANASLSAEQRTAVFTKILKNKIFLLFMLLLIIVLITQLTSHYSTPDRAITTKAKALTRGAGSEYQPQISPDGTRMVYTELSAGKMHLLLKSFADERVVEIEHSGNVRTWVGPGSWSYDGKLLAYLVTTEQSCQYFIRAVDGMALGEEKLIHNCPVGSAGKIAFTHNNNRLVYTESTGRNSPYSLFEINIITNKKRRLPQPELVLNGNIQFDMHPKKDKLLISSPDKQQWEGFYSLDLSSDKLSFLFKQDAYTCCGIWSHQGEQIILMGEHPAYQLISYDQQGGDRHVIYSGSQQLENPERHSNGKDYLFVAGFVDKNIHLYNLTEQTTSLIADSSVDDRLPSFAHHNNQVAYISVTSGSEEIWLTDIYGKQRSKLTSFNDERHYLDLKWSYDGKLILALTLNEIHLIDSDTGNFERLKIPQAEIRKVSFKDNNTLAYSTQLNNQWRVNYYHLDSHQVSQEEPRWKFVQYAKNDEDIIWIDQKHQLYSGPKKLAVDKAIIFSQAAQRSRQFIIKKLANQWFWTQYQSNNYQLITKTNAAAAKKSSVIIDNMHFAVSQHGILFTKVNSNNADIFSSQSEH